MSWLEDVFHLNCQKELFCCSLEEELSPAQKLSTVLRFPPILIAEFKRTTPDRRLITKRSPAELALVYQDSPYVAAVSVVLEPFFFQTTMQDLLTVRRTVSKPLLVKGFFSSFWQLERLQASGADAVLLIAAGLKKRELAILLEGAKKIGLEAVLELHSPDELDKVEGLDFSLFLVNNRNLQTLHIDRLQAMKTALSLRKKIPQAKLILASGFSSGCDLLDFLCFQPEAFLIGSALLSAQNPEAVLDDLGRVIGNDFD